MQQQMVQMQMAISSNYQFQGSVGNMAQLRLFNHESFVRARAQGAPKLRRACVCTVYETSSSASPCVQIKRVSLEFGTHGGASAVC